MQCWFSRWSSGPTRLFQYVGLPWDFFPSALLTIWFSGCLCVGEPKLWISKQLIFLIKFRRSGLHHTHCIKECCSLLLRCIYGGVVSFNSLTRSFKFSLRFLPNFCSGIYPIIRMFLAASMSIKAWIWHSLPHQPILCEWLNCFHFLFISPNTGLDHGSQITSRDLTNGVYLLEWLLDCEFLFKFNSIWPRLNSAQWKSQWCGKLQRGQCLYVTGLLGSLILFFQYRARDRPWYPLGHGKH
jgi:hypothetical protein